MSTDLGPFWIDGPERAGKSDACAFGGADLRIPSADDSDMTRLQEAEQIDALLRCHAPSGLKIAREMMCRWISDVPSQMRSSRESRQSR